ncbi:MAG: hypothetical protein ABI467_29160 [Kofleriaceae bacterium]
MPVVVTVESEFHERLAVARSEPTVDSGTDHDHAEAADRLVVELDERGLHRVERVRVPQLGRRDPPGTAERGGRRTICGWHDELLRRGDCEVVVADGHAQVARGGQPLRPRPGLLGIADDHLGRRTAKIDATADALDPFHGRDVRVAIAAGPERTAIQATSELRHGRHLHAGGYQAGLTGGKKGKVRVQGPHPGRPKEDLPTPEGFVPGEHRGHGAPEGAIDNPNLVNVLNNIESETSASNLGPKKRFDSLVSRTAAAFYDREVAVSFERITSGSDPRPIATKYEIHVDGMTLYKVTISND